MNSATRLLESSFLHGVLGMHRERERERRRRRRRRKETPGGGKICVYTYMEKKCVDVTMCVCASCSINDSRLTMHSACEADMEVH